MDKFDEFLKSIKNSDLELKDVYEKLNLKDMGSSYTSEILKVTVAQSFRILELYHQWLFDNFDISSKISSTKTS